jgi:hypothetical protein
MIDCGGYGSSFDMILFHRVGFLASHDRHEDFLLEDFRKEVAAVREQRR